MTAQRHRPSQQITRDIDTLKRSIVVELPSLVELETQVQKWTTLTALDPKHRPELHDAVTALADAKQVWATRAKQNTELKMLDNELNEAVAAERMEKITMVEQRLGRAIAEYRAAALVCARAVRTVLDESARCSRVPGASGGISALRLDQFHIPSLFPTSNQGSLGEAMMQGLQHFEVENERMAA
jgi:hypothetical protein